MNDLIFERNSQYSEYEALLIRRDDYKKEAFEWDREYIRVFGDRILRNFELKLECIRKKKTITYCQASINHGGVVSMSELQTYLDRELAEYQARLEAMVKDNESAKFTSVISEYELIQIKKLYRKLAKILHPDINPKTMNDERLRDLWERIAVAYKCNKYKDLKELEILVKTALDGHLEVEIEDIQGKILEVLTEIEEIKGTDPYMYKFLLEDDTAVKEKFTELDEEFRAYDEYRIELEELLQNVMTSGGVTFKWETN